MTKPKRRKLNKNIIVAFNRLHRSGRLLCRQFSQSDVKQRRLEVLKEVRDDYETAIERKRGAA